MEAGRRVGSAWLPAVIAVVLLVGTAHALGQEVPCPDCCFEDVVVTGAGAWWANARYEYREGYLSEGRPYFQFEQHTSGTGWTSIYAALYYVGHSIHSVYPSWVTRGWTLYASLHTSEGIWIVKYNTSSGARTVPATGWGVEETWWTTPGACPFDALPIPRVLGGEACSGDLVPAATTGFLDRAWPDGEQRLMVGEMEVLAGYQVGEVITGCCSFTREVSCLTLTCYTVTIGEMWDIRNPVDTQVVQAGDDGRFCFRIETVGWAPGYYDIRMGSPGHDAQSIRVQVVSPARERLVSTVAPLPAGAAGFLDRGWPGGEEPPLVGEMEVSASYQIGEPITGCCRALSLVLAWYAVTIGEEYDAREAIDSRVVRAGSDGRFCFRIETADWTPGCYDIQLSAPGEGCEWIRVEVVAPAE